MCRPDTPQSLQQKGPNTFSYCSKPLQSEPYAAGKSSHCRTVSHAQYGVRPPMASSTTPKLLTPKSNFPSQCLPAAHCTPESHWLQLFRRQLVLGGPRRALLCSNCPLPSLDPLPTPSVAPPFRAGSRLCYISYRFLTERRNCHFPFPPWVCVPNKSHPVMFRDHFRGCSGHHMVKGSPGQAP